MNAGNGTVSKVTSGGAVSAFVASGLNAPLFLAIDGSGSLYVANSGNNTIAKVTAGGAVTQMALR